VGQLVDEAVDGRQRQAGAGRDLGHGFDVTVEVGQEDHGGLADHGASRRCVVGHLFLSARLRGSRQLELFDTGDLVGLAAWAGAISFQRDDHRDGQRSDRACAARWRAPVKSVVVLADLKAEPFEVAADLCAGAGRSRNAWLEQPGQELGPPP
jgi:hypothetical protein